MTEIQTPPSFPPKGSSEPRPGEAVSDADLKMYKAWHDDDSAFAAEAARRTVEADTSSNTYSIPNTETMQDTAPKRKLTAKDAAAGVLATSAFVAGIAGISSTSGGEDSTDQGEASPTTVNSITLSPDARVRQDPEVDNVVTGPNMLFSPGSELEIETNNEVRVLGGTNNGTWYGLTVEDVATKIPGAENLHDKDGIVWVNEAGVKSVDEDKPEESNE